MTALRRTLRTIAGARRVGFQWPDWKGPLAKVKEELAELEREIRKRPKDKALIAGEVGDLLFSVCNLATLLDVDPEESLRGTLEKFARRFRFVADELKKKGKRPEHSNLKEMSSLWRKAKKKPRS